MIVTKSKELQDIQQKIIAQERLSFSEGLFLLTCDESESVRELADFARNRKVGNTVYYAKTLFIHPTNLCELSCPMCSFYAKPGWEKAWFLSPEEVVQKVEKHLKNDLNEIHFVGGLWRDCDLNYYQEVFSKIKQLDSTLHIKALTPVEYDFLSRQHNLSIEEVLLRMQSYGLGSIPGGGAEILVEEIRKKIAPGKISTEEYLQIHEIAHSLNIPSNITMLFGHIEDPEHIIEHLMKIRTLQDKTHGFQTFIPLKYHDENNALGKRKGRLKPKDIRRVYAVSRLLLDNVRNIKVLWNYTGIQEAEELLQWGANDIASTAAEEKIVVMAGGIQVEMTEERLQKSIQQAGRVPKKIHSGYDYTQDNI